MENVHSFREFQVEESEQDDAQRLANEGRRAQRGRSTVERSQPRAGTHDSENREDANAEVTDAASPSEIIGVEDGRREEHELSNGKAMAEAKRVISAARHCEQSK